MYGWRTGLIQGLLSPQLFFKGFCIFHTAPHFPGPLLKYFYLLHTVTMHFSGFLPISFAFLSLFPLSNFLLFIMKRAYVLPLDKPRFKSHFYPT